MAKIEYHGDVDDDGRCHFTLRWTHDDKDRTQCFYADPRKFKFSHPEKGRHVHRKCCAGKNTGSCRRVVV
jgi:hypothetical protein